MNGTPLRVSSRSYADDAAYAAVIDLARACAHLTGRLIGGIAVHLQQRRHDLEDVPDRPTQDADAAIQVAATPDRGRAEVDADVELLLDRLTASNYEQQGRSNRFVRQADDDRPNSVIDVLVPGHYSTIRHNREIAGGCMIVDEVPGLGFALGAQPADIVTLTVDTLDGQELTEIVPLATVFSLLTIKAGACPEGARRRMPSTSGGFSRWLVSSAQPHGLAGPVTAGEHPVAGLHPQPQPLALGPASTAAHPGR